MERLSNQEVKVKNFRRTCQKPFIHLVAGSKKQSRSTSKNQGSKLPKNNHETNLLCCCATSNLEAGEIELFSKILFASLVILASLYLATVDENVDEEEIKEQKDRVSIAFTKFDLDNDGYLSWYEFTQVSGGDHMQGKYVKLYMLDIR